MNSKNEWFKLDKRNRTVLFWYLGILLLLSIIGSAILLYHIEIIISQLGIDKTALISSLIFPILGSTIHYIRKLYKACINLDIVEPTAPTDLIRQSGIIFYFLLRPIFAVGFGFILYLSFKIGISAMVDFKDLNPAFIYSCMFFSFFIGYSAGDVIDKFEKVGKNVVASSFDNQHNN